MQQYRAGRNPENLNSGRAGPGGFCGFSQAGKRTGDLGKNPAGGFLPGGRHPFQHFCPGKKLRADHYRPGAGSGL